MAKLPAIVTTDSKETDAADKAWLEDIEELSKDGQQQAYIQALQNQQAEIRATAAKEVEPVGDAFYLLTDMLHKDPSPEVRIATTWALEDER